MTIAQDYLNGESMKQLRLTSTILAQLLTPLLFEVLVLLPDIDSLKKACKIAEAPLLARHVHVLEIFSRIAPSIRNSDIRSFVQTHLEMKREYPEMPVVDITVQPRQYYYSYL